jgi:flagellar protein FliS
MRHHGYQNYFDNDVLAASPLKLIQMLYAALLDCVRAARRHVRDKDIPARTLAINKAIGIATQLSGCLNHEADVVLSRNLAGLYAYLIRLFIDANLKQSEAPLAEAENLISTLADAWNACAPTPPDRSYPDSDLALQDALENDALVSFR